MKIKVGMISTALAVILTTTLHAVPPPGILNHQGRIAVSGTNYTGTGFFKFALVDAAGTTTLWSNNGTSTGGGQPTAAVSAGVSQGHYALGLGDTAVAGMTAAIPPSVFTGNADVRLRVWFSTNGTTFEQLTPDRRITATGYALTAGAVADPSFIGTTTNTPLDFSVNGERAFRLQPSTNPDFGPTPNLIGGFSGNSIDSSASGAVIAGGGFGGWTNTIPASGSFASLGGGIRNTASGFAAFLGGGQRNVASGDSSMVPGGGDNVASGAASFAAGSKAKAIHIGAFVWADVQTSDFASTGLNQFLIRAEGGVGINKNNPSVALDVNGTVRATSFQGAGAPLSLATTGLQPLNFSVNGQRALRIQPSGIGGDFAPSLVGGGADNSISAESIGSVIGGGGGDGNLANRITNNSDRATIAGGRGNLASSAESTIGGGANNQATDQWATVSGGAFNTASGPYSTVPGGNYNTASGSTSFAAGRNAKAVHAGAFVWADSQNADFSSTGDNQFLIRAAGGVDVTGSQTITGSLRVDSLGTNNAGIFNDNSLTFGPLGSREGIASKRTVGGNQYGLDFYTNNIAQLSILNGGQVGVGTSAPSHTLTVSNIVNEETMRLIGAGNIGQGARLNFGDGDFVYLSEPFDDGLTIQANEVGVGGNPVDGGAKLQVTGDVLITTTDQLAGNDSRGALTIGSVGGTSIGFDRDDIQSYQAANIPGTLNVNQFGGNVRIGSTGASVTVFGTFNNNSDRNAKQDVQPVEPEAILNRLRKLPIATWQYKGAAERRHIGPMAQDFHAAFDDLLELHSDDKTIAPLDEAGVAFASIQALYEKVESENKKLQGENGKLKERLERLERAVEALARPAGPTTLSN